jgi:hypothetical protein
METFLRESTKVPFESLRLDPNNPRLAPDEPPGYTDVQSLLDPELQASLEKRAEEEFDLPSLEQAIIGQGWMPIDNMVIWPHPEGSDANVVLEGNRRLAALRRLRERLIKERAKLERMTSGGKRYSDRDLEEQKQLVAQLERIVADTDPIEVVPLAADTVEELVRKLPRVLAVRHVTGVRQWGNYAEDLWLLARYEHLFEDERPGESLRWDPAIINQLSNEASLTTMSTKRKLRAASAFSHFKRDFEDELPEGEFKPSDYYLFELIVAKPWIRDQFSLGEDDLHVPADRERVLFDWVFKDPRGRDADDNPNVFYRHENIQVWDQMKRYDDRHGTAFAQRFNVEEYESAPTMREVEADYAAHKARRKPADVLESLLQALDQLTAATIRSEGAFLHRQLERLDERTKALLRMVEAAEAA